MERETINKDLLLWILETVDNMVTSSISDNPEKFPTILAVSDMLNKIDIQEKSANISDFIGETLTNKLFEELKNNVKER